MKTKIQRILAVLIPISIGAAAVAYMMSTTRDAPKRPATELSYPMSVIAVPELELEPRAAGYGIAAADRTWRAVARVPGRLVELHPGMRSGGAVNAGDMLVRIDSTDTEIAITSAESDLARLQAELNLLDVEKANNEAALEIERASLEVTSAELKRFEDLLAKDAASAADVEERRRSVLNQKLNLLSIENSQALLPGRRASLAAQVAGAQASLDNATRDRAYCEIRAPFDAILGEVALEVGQFVGTQETLFELYDDSRLRIDAALPQDEVFRLVSGDANQDARTRILAAINNPEQRADLISELFAAEVSAQAGVLRRAWTGKVVGARESLDAETRALRLTVVVEQQRKNMFDNGPPLNRGTYCRVEVRGKSRSGVLAVPRSALRDGDVFTLDSDNRLVRTKVDVEFTQGELAVIQGGLERGTLVIVSPPSPVILGMLVDPVPDEKLLASMRADAAGNDTGDERQ